MAEGKRSTTRSRSRSGSARRPAARKATRSKAADTTKTPAAAAPDVATSAENDRLDHSEGGSTTRDDRLDAGVPMTQGKAAEPVGPEDALGAGEKRGDYRGRVDGNPHTSEPTADGGEPIRAEDGTILDYQPKSRLVSQRPRTEDIATPSRRRRAASPRRATRRPSRPRAT